MKAILFVLAIVLASSIAPGQDTPASSSRTPQSRTAADDNSLSPGQIPDLIRRTAENDIQNDKKLLDYTYLENVEEQHLDSKGKVKSSETKTNEIMMLYGSQVKRLIAKNGQPLSTKAAAQEDERVQKIADKRKNESPEQRAKRLRQEEKDHQETREFVNDIANAYNFHLMGIEAIAGRDTYVIDAEPRPGFEPHAKGAKFLPKFRFRIWIDKLETQWVKLDAEAIDNVSVGLFLARFHKGSRIVIEQTRVNDEVWLPRHLALKVDVRLALVKDFNVAQDVTYRDYKKFRSNTRIVPISEGSPQP
jgi:hypothetical protein